MLIIGLLSWREPSSTKHQFGRNSRTNNS